MLISLWGHLSYFLFDFFFYITLIIVSFSFCALTIPRIYKSALSDRRKGIFLSVIFSLFSLVLIYSGFEAYFRYRFDESDSLGFLKVTSKWNSRHVVSNNYQYRDRNFTPEKKPGRVRIGIMGDSIVFGYGIKNPENRFSNILGQKLQKNRYNAEVYNFGVSGIDTDQEINEYERVKSLNFDIVIWSYFLNDVEPASSSIGSKVLKKAQNAPAGIFGFLSGNSFFFNYVYWRLSAAYLTTFAKLENTDLQQFNNPSVFAYHKQIVGQLANNIKASGAKTIVIIFPFLTAFPDYPKEAIEVHHRMEALFKENGVTSVVDMMQYVKGKSRKDLVVGPYDSHPNELVHALAAEKLYDAISPLLENKDGKTIIRQQ